MFSRLRVLDIEKIEQFVYFTYRDYKLSQNFRYTVFHAPHGTIIRRTITRPLR